MSMALDLAQAAAQAGEVPVGAIIVDETTGEVLGRGQNGPITAHDPTAHAEIVALRDAAAKLQNYRLTDLTLYVTLEPCAMCAAAISFARIRRLYYGAEDPKGGAVDNGVRFFAQPTCHHAPDVYSGIGGTEAADILKDFFRERRET